MGTLRNQTTIPRILESQETKSLIRVSMKQSLNAEKRLERTRDRRCYFPGSQNQVVEGERENERRTNSASHQRTTESPHLWGRETQEELVTPRERGREREQGRSVRRHLRSQRWREKRKGGSKRRSTARPRKSRKRRAMRLAPNLSFSHGTSTSSSGVEKLETKPLGSWNFHSGGQ